MGPVQPPEKPGHSEDLKKVRRLLWGYWADGKSQCKGPVVGSRSREADSSWREGGRKGAVGSRVE